MRYGSEARIYLRPISVKIDARAGAEPQDRAVGGHRLPNASPAGVHAAISTAVAATAVRAAAGLGVIGLLGWEQEAEERCRRYRSR